MGLVDIVEMFEKRRNRLLGLIASEISDDAAIMGYEYWKREYENNKAKNVPDGYVDTWAYEYAQSRLLDYYTKLKRLKFYFERDDNEK